MCQGQATEEAAAELGVRCLAELIISNHSQLWPGQHRLVPFGFAVVVFSSLRVLTKMTAIVISCTNCLLFIRAMVSMGSAGQLLMGIQQNPHWGRGWTRSLACSGGLAAQPGTAGRGGGEIPAGLVPRNAAGFVLLGVGSSAPCQGRAALQSPAGAAQCSPRCLCAQQLWDPAGHLCRARGGSSPRNVPFPGLLSPKVQPARRRTPLGTAGLISSPWQLFMLLSGNYSLP